METIKKVVYRNDDQVLVSEANSGKVVVKFLPELTNEQQTACNDLKTYCEGQIDTDLNYVVYLSEGNTLNIEDSNNKTITQVVNELPAENKSIIDTVGLLCTQFLNE